MKKKEAKALLPFEEILSERKTMSDMILEKAADMGCPARLSAKEASELALFYSSKLEADINKTEEVLAKI
jgi:hypothetical protein